MTPHTRTCRRNPAPPTVPGPGRETRRPRFRRAAARTAALTVVLLWTAAAGLAAWVGPLAAQSARAENAARVAIGATAPDFGFTTVEGKEYRLSQFRGKPVMLWFFASWCPSCIAGTKAVVENYEALKRRGLTIVQLRLYKNLGYPGPSAAAFAKRYAAGVHPDPSWLWGEASREASFTYDRQGFPDIYFLIDGEGVIRAMDGVPNVTMARILAFAEKASGRGADQ